MKQIRYKLKTNGLPENVWINNINLKTVHIIKNHHKQYKLQVVIDTTNESLREINYPAFQPKEQAFSIYKAGMKKKKRGIVI